MALPSEWSEYSQWTKTWIASRPVPSWPTDWVIAQPKGVGGALPSQWSEKRVAAVGSATPYLFAWSGGAWVDVSTNLYRHNGSAWVNTLNGG